MQVLAQMSVPLMRTVVGDELRELGGSKPVKVLVLNLSSDTLSKAFGRVKGRSVMTDDGICE